MAKAKEQEAEQPSDTFPPASFAQDGHSERQSGTGLPVPAQHAAFSKKELATSLGHTATETLVLLVARNNGCVLPPSHSP